MNVIMFCSGELKSIPRKEKKHLKIEVKNSIMELYKKKPIKDLTKIALTTQWAIYSTTEDRDVILIKFPNLSPTTNYFVGKVEINKQTVYYLIDVDELFYTNGQYVIWPNNLKKRIIITN